MSKFAHRARSQTTVWLTPPEIIKALGPFDLDPCAAPDPRPWPTASIHYTEGGLSKPWNGFVWCNPPYGQEVWKWLRRMADHGNGIALVFARTETVGFFDTAWDGATSVLFLKGRIHYYRPDGTRAKGNSGAPSVLVAYGNRANEAIKQCEIPGAHVFNWTVIDTSGEKIISVSSTI
jgi:hypothetical protein